MWCFRLIGLVLTNDIEDSINWYFVLSWKLFSQAVYWLDYWTFDFTVMHMNWKSWDNCWDNCFRRPSVNWNYLDNRVLEGSVIWKLGATTLWSTINWFGQYTTLPRYQCLSNRMEKFPAQRTICKVYTAALCFILSSIDLMEGVCSCTIIKYKTMTFLEQLISWAASEICTDNSYQLQTVKIICLDNSISVSYTHLTLPTIYSV